MFSKTHIYDDDCLRIHTHTHSQFDWRGLLAVAAITSQRYLVKGSKRHTRQRLVKVQRPKRHTDHVV